MNTLVKLNFAFIMPFKMFIHIHNLSADTLTVNQIKNKKFSEIEKYVAKNQNDHSVNDQKR